MQIGINPGWCRSGRQSPTGTLGAASDCADARWVPIAELDAWETTDGLAPVVRRAQAMRDAGERGPHRETDRR